VCRRIGGAHSQFGRCGKEKGKRVEGIKEMKDEK
jgi:hypothetical protein